MQHFRVSSEARIIGEVVSSYQYFEKIFQSLSDLCIMSFYAGCLVFHAAHLRRNGQHVLDRHLYV